MLEMATGRSSFILKQLSNHRDRSRHVGMDGAVMWDHSDLIEQVDISLTVRQDAAGERICGIVRYDIMIGTSLVHPFTFSPTWIQWSYRDVRERIIRLADPSIS